MFTVNFPSSLLFDLAEGFLRIKSCESQSRQTWHSSVSRNPSSFDALWDCAAEVSHSGVVARRRWRPESVDREFRLHTDGNGGTGSKKLLRSSLAGGYLRQGHT